MSNWQPIETCPDDGTHFLATWEWENCKGVWFNVVMRRIGKDFVVAWTSERDCAEPTHWMPLPQPPEMKQ